MADLAGGAGQDSGALPRRLSSFVGRDHELAEVAAELAATRALTLTGTGGCGKTSLALEAARAASGHGPDGVVWVDLAPLGDPDLVAPALAQAFGLRPPPGDSGIDTTIAFLRTRQVLVVLDNCEHVVGACAKVAEALLVDCDGVKVLATSRVPLGIGGEVEWRVPSLRLPEDDAVGRPLRSDAVRLFVERAQGVRPGFAADGAVPPAVVDICRRLDGIPLAIELAAARLRLMSVQEIAGGLDDALTVVAGGARTAPPRYRTLRASIDWSYDLLDPPQRTLLRRLGVFTGGFTLASAQAVGCDESLPDAQVLDLLGELVAHSLVQVDDTAGVSRYRLLETVRQYAVERLSDSDELDELRDRHRDALLDVAERLGAEIVSPRQPVALTALDREAANLLTAFDRAIYTDPAKALRFCGALAFWFRLRGRFREADDLYSRALAAGGASPPALRSRALSALARMLGHRTQLERVIALTAQAQQLAEESGDPGAITDALLVSAYYAVFVDPARAVAQVEQCRERAEVFGDAWTLTRTSLHLSLLAFWQQDADRCHEVLSRDRQLMVQVGDRETLAWACLIEGISRYASNDLDKSVRLFDAALAYGSEIGEPFVRRGAPMFMALVDVAAGRAAAARDSAVAVHEELVTQGGIYGAFYGAWLELVWALADAGLGDLGAAAARLGTVVAGESGYLPTAIVWAEAELAEIARLRGDLDASRTHATRGLERGEELGNPWWAAKARLVLGRLLAHEGNWTDAERLHHDALTAIVERGLRLELPRALEALAEVAAGLESDVEAARLLGVAERMRGADGPVMWPAQHAEVERLGAEIRRRLGDTQFDRACSEAAALTTDEAIAWVRRARGDRQRPSRGWESLTPTELAVVRHVAAGLTNPQIGERMFISRATVKTHLAHVFAKLGVTNRAELSSEAAHRLDLS